MFVKLFEVILVVGDPSSEPTKPLLDPLRSVGWEGWDRWRELLEVWLEGKVRQSSRT